MSYNCEKSETRITSGGQDMQPSQFLGKTQNEEYDRGEESQVKRSNSSILESDEDDYNVEPNQKSIATKVLLELEEEHALQRIPLSKEIRALDIPFHIKIPPLKYYGTTDPNTHLQAFENWMDLYKGASGNVRCKMFPVTFRGRVTKWYKNYQGETIYCWTQFCSKFRAQFHPFKDPSMHFTQLATIRQESGEPLSQYLKRFNTEAFKAEDATDRDKLIAVISGLIPKTLFWEELQIHDCNDLQQFYLRAEKFARLEETRHAKRASQLHQMARGSNSNHPSKKSKKEDGIGRSWKRIPKPNYVKLNKPLSHILTIAGYNVNFPMIHQTHKQREPNQGESYCNYHQESGHETDNCRVLAGIIQNMIKSGLLKEFVKEV